MKARRQLRARSGKRQKRRGSGGEAYRGHRLERSERLSLTGRERALRLDVKSTSAPCGRATALGRAPPILAERVGERRGSGGEVTEQALQLRQGKREGLPLFLITGNRTVVLVRPITHAGNRERHCTAVPVRAGWSRPGVTLSPSSPAVSRSL